MKLCKDQLTEKLVGLFAETDPGNIDEAVAQAKGQLTQKTKLAKRNDLERLFDSYLDRLTNRGCPKQFLEMAREHKNKVVAKASEMSISEGHIPFVGPIIKAAYLGYYGLMSMVRNGDEEGYTHLDPSRITDEFPTPDGLYWLYDVEDGEAMRGKVLQDAEKLIKKQGRSGLTAIHLIRVCIHR